MCVQTIYPQINRNKLYLLFPNVPFKIKYPLDDINDGYRGWYLTGGRGVGLINDARGRNMIPDLNCLPVGDLHMVSW